MSDLNISKKNIYNVFSERGVKFLIPDYQRPYSWGRDECETLWEDLKNFALPTEKNFNPDKDEYFLGTIVTFDNGCSQKEVIDGQQRLITLLLLLRAFYEALLDSKAKVNNQIAECIWFIDEDDNPDKSRLKIESEVATEENINELQNIIDDGVVTNRNKSLYAQNYYYFQKKIDELKISDPENFSYLPRRIMKNCIVLPIEAGSLDTALRIFTTLNDRGLPLSDSDIFKSQFYKFFKSQGKTAKDNFIKRWKELDEICNKIFHPRTGTPTDDLFMKYMYCRLAKDGKSNYSLIGLRPYFEKENYSAFKSNKNFEDLLAIANFWNDIALRDKNKFSDRVLKRLYVLEYSPNNVWEHAVSIYFIGNRDSQNLLNDEKFYNFLNKITATLFMLAIFNPGNHNIRRPFFYEFQNIFSGNELNFEQYKLNKKSFQAKLIDTKFSNTKAITRAMLAWWLFQNENQELPPLDTRLEIEHIYAKRRAEFEPFQNAENLELLGNKTLLEKRINIRASDYRFADKKKYYSGNNKNAPTFNLELLKLAKIKNDFTESDILERNEEIFNGFIKYLAENNLLR